MSKKINIPEPLGFILMFLLGLLFIFSSELIILNCNRFQLNQKVTCKVTHFGLRGKHITLIPVGKLQSAETQRMGKRNNRVILLTQKDTIPIQDIFSGSSKSVASQKAEQINSFLNNPEQMSFKMKQYPNWFLVLWGIIFVLLPVLALVLKLSDYGERKSRIRRIQREISYPYHQDDKSSL